MENRDTLASFAELGNKKETSATNKKKKGHLKEGE